MRFPPPVDVALFTSRRQGASYLGAWGLTAAHLVLWILLAAGGLPSGTTLEIGLSLLSFSATCLLVGMVIATHRRLEITHGGATRHVATVLWRGPWDPVGRQVWLPVRLPEAWKALVRGPQQEPRPPDPRPQDPRPQDPGPGGRSGGSPLRHGA